MVNSEWINCWIARTRGAKRAKVHSTMQN